MQKITLPTGYASQMFGIKAEPKTEKVDTRKAYDIALSKVVAHVNKGPASKFVSEATHQANLQKVMGNPNITIKIVKPDTAIPMTPERKMELRAIVPPLLVKYAAGTLTKEEEELMVLISDEILTSTGSK